MLPGKLLQGTAGYASSLLVVCSTFAAVVRVAATNGYMIALRDNR
jgi:hypothetical protein